MSVKCTNCKAPAEIHAGWPTSRGWQEGDYCNACMRKTWDQFKSTPAMSAAQFRPVRQPAENSQ